jgi:hypothetical protein
MIPLPIQANDQIDIVSQELMQLKAMSVFETKIEKISYENKSYYISFQLKENSETRSVICSTRA